MCQNAGNSTKDTFLQTNVINYYFSFCSGDVGRDLCSSHCQKYKFGDCIVQSDPQV